jgi:serine/threonine protein kinase
MNDRIGTEIAGYRIESLLARGGMGEVYLATQALPERRVALKLQSSEVTILRVPWFQQSERRFRAPRSSARRVRSAGANPQGV